MKNLTSYQEAFDVMRRIIWRYVKKYLTPCHEVFDAMQISCWVLNLLLNMVERITTSLVVAYAVSFTIALEKLSLLGLMAKIKCSICSYQFNIWYAGHRPAHILIWFLAFGQGSEACFTLTTGCLGMALQPSAAHYLTKKIELSLAKVLYKSYMYHLTTIFPDTPGTSAFNFNFSLISRS